MRRFVFEDETYNIQITLDLPEELFQQLQEAPGDHNKNAKELIKFSIEQAKEKHYKE